MVVLQLNSTSGSPGELVKTQIAGSTSRLMELRLSLRIFISYKILDAAAAGGLKIKF